MKKLPAILLCLIELLLCVQLSHAQNDSSRYSTNQFFDDMYFIYQNSTNAQFFEDQYKQVYPRLTKYLNEENVTPSQVRNLFNSGIINKLLNEVDRKQIEILRTSSVSNYQTLSDFISTQVFEKYKKSEITSLYNTLLEKYQTSNDTIKMYTDLKDIFVVISSLDPKPKSTLIETIIGLTTDISNKVDDFNLLHSDTLQIDNTQLTNTFIYKYDTLIKDYGYTFKFKNKELISVVNSNPEDLNKKIAKINSQFKIDSFDAASLPSDYDSQTLWESILTFEKHLRTFKLDNSSPTKAKPWDISSTIEFNFKEIKTESELTIEFKAILDSNEVLKRTNIEINSKTLEDKINKLKVEQRKLISRLVNIKTQMEFGSSTISDDGQRINLDYLDETSISTPNNSISFDKISSKTSQLNFQGLSQSEIIDGTATFLAQRFKSEVKIAFFQKFKTVFYGENANRYTKLFSNTFKFLQSANISRTDEFFNYLKYNFEKDSRQLLYNGVELVLNKTDKDKTDIFLLDISQILKFADDKSDLLVVLSDKELINLIKTEELKTAVNKVSLISNLLLAQNSTSSTWVEKETFNKVWNNLKMKEIITTLWSAYLKSQPEEISSTLTSLANNNFELISTYYKALKVIDEAAEIINSKEKALLKLSNSDFERYYASTLSLLSITLEEYLEKISKLKEKEISDQILLSSDNLRLADIQAPQKDLIQNKVDVYMKKITSQIESLKTAYIYTKTKNYTLLGYHVLDFMNDELLEKKNFMTINSETSSFLNDIATYINLVTSIGQAKSSQEVTSILESITLPPGSYSSKRINKYEISINSYVGLLFGREAFFDNDSFWKFQYKSGNIGFTAPIGIAFSTALSKSETKVHNIPKTRKKRIALLKSQASFYDDKGNKRYSTGNSMSLFFTIFDLGAPVLYRFRNEGDGEFPDEVKISQFVSPGASIVYGFRNTGLSAYTGLQITPELRTSLTLTQEPVIRMNFGLLIDIPLFNIVSVSR